MKRVLRGVLIKIGLAALVFGAIALYAQADIAANYEPAAAQVTKVEEVCYLKKKERGVFTKTTTTTKEGPCAAVRQLNITHPEYQDFDLVTVTYVEFRYRSPADGKMYRGKDKQVDRKEGGLPLRSGDEGVVLAHKEDPKKTMRFRSSL